MSDTPHDLEGEIIHAAYAERVRDAFRVFAEAISMGESDKLCKERFLRTLQMTRRARDLAIDAIRGIDMVEPVAEIGDERKRRYGEEESEPLSAEYQALVKSVTDQTTGVSHRPIERKPLQRR